MKTCLEDDRPILSLLYGLFWIAIGTWSLFLWHSLTVSEFGWTWIPIALAQYGLGFVYPRCGESYRSERVKKLFEPRW